MEIRKTLVLFFALWFVMTFQKLDVLAAGNGTLLNPWQISTVDDLQAIGTVGDWDDAYILMNDLDLSALNWTALGTPGSNTFSGSFDGNGHTIDGLTIDLTDVSSSYVSVGLFYGLVSATIKDLTLSNIDIQVTVTDTDLYVGALAGTVEAEDGEVFLIDQVNVSGTMNVLYNYDTFEGHDRFVGGMIGYTIGDNDAQYASLISNCIVSLELDVGLYQHISGWYAYADSLSIGGYVGKASDVLFQSNVLEASTLTFNQDLSTDGYDGFGFGGMVGQYTTSTDFSQDDLAIFDGNTIRSSSITGYSGIGGLLGTYYNIVNNTIKNTNISDLEIIGSYNLGGVVGKGLYLLFDSVDLEQLEITNFTEYNVFFGGVIGCGFYTDFMGQISIDGFTFRKTDSEHNASTVGSLAGILQDSTISANIDAKNIDIIANSNVGGLIGSANNVTIDQAKVSNASIIGINQVGGIVGGSQVLYVNNVSFDGIIRGDYGVGGIVGYTNADQTIDHAIVMGDIYINGYFGGGMIGKSIHNWNDSDTLSITESYVRANIHYTYDAFGVGGIIGCASNNSNNNSNRIYLTDVYFAGELLFVPDAEHASYDNGFTLDPILGRDMSPGSHVFTHVYYDNTLFSGTNNSGIGTGKTTAEMMEKTGYEGFDFTGLDHWFITSSLNDGYATFNPGLIRIDFMDSEGNLLDIQIINPNTKLTPIDAPKLEGFIFDQWLDEEDAAFDINNPLTDSIVLKASYKEYIPDTGSSNGLWIWMLSLSLGIYLISSKKTLNHFK